MAETVAPVFGGLYLLVGGVGFLLNPGGGSLLGRVAVLLAHANAPVLTDNLLHFISGLGFAYSGWLPRAPAAPARAR